jgi:hypothetical protein
VVSPFLSDLADPNLRPFVLVCNGQGLWSLPHMFPVSSGVWVVSQVTS